MAKKQPADSLSNMVAEYIDMKERLSSLAITLSMLMDDVGLSVYTVYRAEYEISGLPGRKMTVSPSEEAITVRLGNAPTGD